jgi:hypothetical protein
MWPARGHVAPPKNRYDMVIFGGGELFLVEENPSANPRPTAFENIGEQRGLGIARVRSLAPFIVAAASRFRVDSGFIAAIIQKEENAGWYDAGNPRRKSIRPMNINLEVWGGYFGGENARKRLRDPWENILAGAEILRDIDDHVDPTLIGGARRRVIATLYNSLYRSRVSDYGARVNRIYEEQEWPPY